jgi:hypothetical protein
MTTTKQSKSAVQAAEFLLRAKHEGFRTEVKFVSGGDAIVTIEASFEPGDRDAYVRFDGSAYFVLANAPTVTYGSTWGTDGASVGGAAGLYGGYYRLSKSGVSKRFANALLKAIS